MQYKQSIELTSVLCVCHSFANKWLACKFYFCGYSNKDFYCCHLLHEFYILKPKWSLPWYMRGTIFQKQSLLLQISWVTIKKNLFLIFDTYRHKTKKKKWHFVQNCLFKYLSFAMVLMTTYFYQFLKRN